MRPISAFVVFVAVVIALVVVYYIRRWRLREEYSLLWLFLSGALVVLTVDQGLMEWAADRLGVAYSPAVLFFLALAFVAVMLFHYSLEISRLSDQNRMLAQELGLLRAGMERAGLAALPLVAAPSEVHPPVADDDALQNAHGHEEGDEGTAPLADEW